MAEHEAEKDAPPDRARVTVKALRAAAEWLFAECERRDENSLWNPKETAGIERAGHMLLQRAAWIDGVDPCPTCDGRRIWMDEPCHECVTPPEVGDQNGGVS